MAYANPLQHADVTPERIDQGVDYGVHGGYLSFIADSVVTEWSSSAWAPYGGYFEYRITERGPLEGMHVYYAEGVTAPQSVGRSLPGGAAAVQLIPGWRYGIEIGWAAGDGSDATWARVYGGGYSEGQVTKAGVNFSSVITRLGGPGGIVDGPIVGVAPPPGEAFLRSGLGPGSSGGPGTTPAPVVGQYNSIYGATNAAGLIDDAWKAFGGHGVRALDNSMTARRLVMATRYVTTQTRSPRR